MASKRCGFISTLKCNALIARKKRIRRKIRRTTLRAESPLRRALTDDELTLLEEIGKEENEINPQASFQASTSKIVMLPENKPDRSAEKECIHVSESPTFDSPNKLSISKKELALLEEKENIDRENFQKSTATLFQTSTGKILESEIKEIEFQASTPKIIIVTENKSDKSAEIESIPVSELPKTDTTNNLAILEKEILFPNQTENTYTKNAEKEIMDNEINPHRFTSNDLPLKVNIIPLPTLKNDTPNTVTDFQHKQNSFDEIENSDNENPYIKQTKNHKLSPEETISKATLPDDKLKNTFEIEFESGLSNPKFHTLNFHDTLPSEPMVNSKNPVLCVNASPASPLLPANRLISDDALMENIESPNFSPTIYDQIMELEGPSPNFPPPRTPLSIALNSPAPETPYSDFQESPAPDTPSFVDRSPASILPNPDSEKSYVSSQSSLNIVAPKKRQCSLKTDPGRKRLKNMSEWKDVQRKVNRNLGKEYINRKGEYQKEREMGDTCSSGCRLKCYQKIDEKPRQRSFRNFWALGDLVRQWDYINKFCRRIQKRRMTTDTDSKRQFTLLYSLPGNTPGTTVKVCKVMFLNTLGIKQGLVFSALNKLTLDGTVDKDKRGTHGKFEKKITDEMKSSVSDHVISFAPIESHYVRSRSSKKYLDGSLSIAKMFLLYKEWNDPKNQEKVLTLRQYRDIVNARFNIGFYTPKKDQCDVCHAQKNIENPVTLAEHQKYTDHLRNKTIARELKEKQKQMSKDRDDTITAVYDFQKVHSLPHAETSVLYYKRKLSIFNFTVYDLGNKIGTCYVWDESTAKRGSIEVSSCLYDFISSHAEKGTKTFNFWSDNCSGQNRNRIVFAAYQRAAHDYKVKINHTYLEKGHTQNEGDSVHSLIERSAKPKTIYTPDQWYAMIRWCKQTGHPYIVKEMTTSDFLDFKILLPGCNWTSDVDKNAVMWSKIRQIQIFPNETGKIYFKTDFCSHEWKCIIVDKKSPNSQEETRTEAKSTRRQRPKTVKTVVVPMHSRRLGQAYQSKLPISKDKLKDLMTLCSQKIIPRQYHEFYENLKGDDNDLNILGSDEE